MIHRRHLKWSIMTKYKQISMKNKGASIQIFWLWSFRTIKILRSWFQHCQLTQWTPTCQPTTTSTSFANTKSTIQRTSTFETISPIAKWTQNNLNMFNTNTKPMEKFQNRSRQKLIFQKADHLITDKSLQIISWRISLRRIKTTFVRGSRFIR